MALTKAVVLGRGDLMQRSRDVVARIARELPKEYRLWPGLRMFGPSGSESEIDAVVIGHDCIYLLELKEWSREYTTTARLEQTVAIAMRKAKELRHALAQRVAGGAPPVEPIVVLTHETAETVALPALRGHVAPLPELSHMLLSGRERGATDPASSTSRPPLSDTMADEVASILGSLQRAVRPGRGNLLQELQLLQRDLAAELQDGEAVGTSLLPIEEHAALWILVVMSLCVLVERGLIVADRLIEGSPGRSVREDLQSTLEHVAGLPLWAPIVATLRDRTGKLAPSANAAELLLEFIRRPDAAGRRQWQFSAVSGRLWGDLYQDLSPTLRAEHGMIQTPEFVEAFILDHTLTPALTTFGAEAVDVLDPACGSGSLLVGAFTRLCQAGLSPEQSISRVRGVDINPVATLVARIRLLFAYIERASALSPAAVLYIETADALLANDSSVLAHRYAVVVTNPPSMAVRGQALIDVYRPHYQTAVANSSLASLFIERCVGLARADGFIGAFTSKSFMNRQFGRPLVEKVLGAIELTHIIDASNVFIPGYSVPMAILFARKRAPGGAPIRVVTGKSAEPVVPADPARGRVWSTLVRHLNDSAYEDAFIAVHDQPREHFARHPWHLHTQRERAVMALLERNTSPLHAVASVRIGGHDDLFVVPEDFPARYGIPGSDAPVFIDGDDVRDFAATAESRAIVVDPARGSGALEGWLWPYRAFLQDRAATASVMPGLGRQIVSESSAAGFLAVPLVATRNHVALIKGAVAPAKTVAIIDVLQGSSAVLPLLAYLGSSVVCLWLKQIALIKTSSKGGAWFDLSGCLARVPVPRAILEPGSVHDSLLAIGGRLSAEAEALASCAPSQVLSRWHSSGGSLADAFADAQMRERTSLGRIVCASEDADWSIYRALGLTTGEYVDTVGAAIPEQRPYAWLSEDSPVGLDRRIRATWRPRRAAIRADLSLAVLESPEYKRQFSGFTTAYDERAADACELWLLSRIEALFRDDAPRCADVAELAVRMATMADACAVADNLAQRRGHTAAPSLEVVLSQLLAAHAVGYSERLRYTAAGRRKREVWAKAWELQRRQDAGEVVDIADRPPLFDRQDYRDALTFRQRGKLDLARERFIEYVEPGANEASYGWAGWTAAERADVLMSWIREKQAEGASAAAVAPMLVGILELAPWMPSWHGPHAVPGSKAAHYRDWVAAQAQLLGIPLAHLSTSSPS